MIVDRDKLIEELFRAFPQRVVDGRAAPHECRECNDICAGLAGKTWKEIPCEFLEVNCGGLPLLSKDAYVAYLVAWLRQGLLEPECDIARTLAVNLIDAPPVKEFTDLQSVGIGEAAIGMLSLDWYGVDDSGNQEDIKEVRRLWIDRKRC
jgi:hypothetical protein